MLTHRLCWSRGKSIKVLVYRVCFFTSLRKGVLIIAAVAFCAANIIIFENILSIERFSFSRKKIALFVFDIKVLYGGTSIHLIEELVVVGCVGGMSPSQCWCALGPVTRWPSRPLIPSPLVPCSEGSSCRPSPPPDPSLRTSLPRWWAEKLPPMTSPRPPPAASSPTLLTSNPRMSRM